MHLFSNAYNHDALKFIININIIKYYLKFRVS